SLCRQTAAFRPLQRWSLLERADEWERLALPELEGYYESFKGRIDHLQPRPSQPAAWQMLNAAYVFAHDDSRRTSFRRFVFLAGLPPRRAVGTNPPPCPT